jgi:hypothetical protein
MLARNRAFRVVTMLRFPKRCAAGTHTAGTDLLASRLESLTRWTANDTLEARRCAGPFLFYAAAVRSPFKRVYSS